MAKAHSVREYVSDFPRLIHPPARSYFHTLILEGVPPDEAAISVVLLDLCVRDIVLAVQGPNELGNAAPETINESRAGNYLEDISFRVLLTPNEVLACIDNAVLILRHEVEMPDFWPQTQNT